MIDDATLDLELSGEALDRWAVQVVRSSSLPTWLLLRLLATSQGALQFFRIYSYFRWVDDIIDAPGRDQDAVEAFAEGQLAFVDALLTDQPVSPAKLPERALCRAWRLAPAPRTEAAIRGMLAAVRFDAGRHGEPITRAELLAQIHRVGDAYIAAQLVATGVDGEVPEVVRELARAATATHHLRDLVLDLELGYFNVPAEDAKAHGFSPMRFDQDQVSAYVLARAPAIEARYRAGLAVLDQLPWRARVLGHLYARRYRRALRRIVRSARARVRILPSPSPGATDDRLPRTVRT